MPSSSIQACVGYRLFKKLEAFVDGRMSEIGSGGSIRFAYEKNALESRIPKIAARLAV